MSFCDSDSNKVLVFFRKRKMAFEDRCSPQSAPSPPGIPHSPHKTAIVLVTNGSDSQNIYNNVYVRYSTANSKLAFQ